MFDGAFGAGDYLAARRRVRLAARAARRRRHRRPAALHRRRRRRAPTRRTSWIRARQDAFFVAFSPRARLAFGYVWRTADFPWMGIWEENHSRTQPPWNGETMTRGHGVRRVADPGVAPRDDRSRPDVRRADLPVDPGAEPGGGRVLDHLPPGFVAAGANSSARHRDGAPERLCGDDRMLRAPVCAVCGAGITERGTGPSQPSSRGP